MLRSDNRTITAFLRLVASRLDVPAIGVFLLDGANAALLTATDEFLHTWSQRSGTGSEAGDGAKISGAVETQIGRSTPSRVDPAAFGLESAYAVIMPICSGSEPRAFLLLLSARRRWLGPGVAGALQDAADVLQSLLPTPVEQASPAVPADRATHADENVAPLAHAAPSSHAEALRLIRDMCNTPDGGARGLLMLDLDRFRAINEALGTTAGDVILARTASRLARHIDPERERLARLGGDRFLILSDRSGAALAQYAIDLLDCVAEPFTVRDEPVQMQATIGLVFVEPGEDIPAATLFMRADRALKRGKTAGGNRVMPHDPCEDAALRDRSRLELDLNGAIKAEQLRLVYQPYVRLLDDSVAGVEALLRWQHPGRGELSPGSFMTLAETSGQILPIGSWVLREALCSAAEWPGETRLSVNISALQFQQADFIAQVDSALALSGFPADRLELEITETVLMRDDPETLGQLRMLIARGIRIALDDFGTGYSALSYLARLPHHRIKLDKSFIDDLGNPGTRDVIKAIVASARAQGIAVTAEGVETADCLERVRQIGFTHAQGFEIGTPMEDPGQILARPFRCATA